MSGSTKQPTLRVDDSIETLRGVLAEMRDFINKQLAQKATKEDWTVTIKTMKSRIGAYIKNKPAYKVNVSIMIDDLLPVRTKGCPTHLKISLMETVAELIPFLFPDDEMETDHEEGETKVIKEDDDDDVVIVFDSRENTL